MLITDVKTTTLRYRRAERMADALNSIPERCAVLVHVHTDEGLVGLGESAHFGGPPETTASIVENELGRLVIGQRALDVERIWHRMFHRSMQHGRRGVLLSAMSGIDIALWDLLGQVTGQPVHRLLGTFRTSFPAYASGGFYRDERGVAALVAEMRSYVERGFRAVKMKVGRNPDVALNPLASVFDDGIAGLSVDEDLERVRAVREAIGPDCRLMVDANSGWNVNTALRALPALADADVDWLEEPLFPEDIAGSARLVQAGIVPIAGYETIQGRFGFNQMLAAGGVDIVQPDVTWSGGITESRRIAGLASAHSKACAPHIFGSAVGLAANAHLLASLPNGLILELDQTPNPLRDELAATPIALRPDGTVEVPDEPGLGVTLDDDVVARYRSDGQTTPGGG